MALPAGVLPITVTGTFLDPAGSPLRGFVTFTPSVLLADATGTAVIAPVPRRYEFAGGSFTAEGLAATDSTALLPEGWNYTVSVCVQDAQPFSFSCFIPHSPSPVDFSSLTPLEPAAIMASYLPLTGGQMTGPLYARESPVTSAEVATKGYVDAVTASLAAKAPVQEATTVALPANTATTQTLTANFTGALTVDGVSVQAGDRMLVKNESTAANNGIYVVTAPGSPVTPYVLTRSPDMNVAADIPGAYAYVEQGTVNRGSGFIAASTGPYVLGTTAITWTQMTGLGEVTAGTGLTASGNTISLSAPVAISSGGTGSITQNFVDLSTTQSVGGTKTFTGEVIVPAPSGSTDAATKAYVDSLAQGLQVKQAVNEATAAALPANSYSSGVLTATSSGALTVDGITVATNDRVLVKNEATAANNGLYVVTNTGSVSAAYVLTRTSDMNTGTQVPGAFVFVETGTANSSTGWVVSGAGPFTIGTTAITWTQFSAAGSITAGTGLTLAGGVMALASPVTVAHGGTGSTVQNFTGLLTRTTVKTSNYTASAGDYVACDSTSAGFTVTLPNAPAANTAVGVKLIASASAPNAVTVACAGTDVINKSSGAVTYTLSLVNQGVTLQYASGIWLIQNDDLPLGQLDARYPQRAAGTSSPAAPLTYFNPKDDGAAFNGSTDDSAHLNTTLARGNTIQFPAGTTVVNAAQLTFPSSSMHIRGAGMYDTTVQCTSGSLSSLWVHGPGFVSDVELSDMTLDGTGVSVSAVAAFGNHLDRLRIRRCRFINWPSVIIQPGYAAEVIVEDCEADGAGSGLGTFFLATNRENESVIIRRNRIRWLNTGITIGSGNPGSSQYHSAYIDISDNYIDLGWWLLKAVSFNSGGTVTYTATTVADSSAPFGATNSIAAGTTIRALTPLRTGTLTTIGTQVTDSSANFITASVWRGHIVRSGTAFAVVSKVESATQMHVEEWLDQTTYQPVTPPTSASYTIYGVILGAVVSNTSTSVTIAHGGGGNGGGWYDLQGNSVTPASGTLFEILPPHPVYPIFVNVPAEKVKIHGNTVRRGWGDNIEFFGSRGIITGNIVEDGQDEGIVIEGFSTTFPGVKTIAANNICRHNGTSGLDVINQADCEIGPNQLEDNTWGDPSSLNIGQLQLINCVNTTITGGRATSSGESAISQAGLSISGSSTSGIKVIGFSGHGAAAGDVYIASTVPAGVCDLLDIDGTIAYQGTANGQRTRVKGTGVPSLIASPGSQFLRTDGTGGSTLYVKETLNTSTGWNAFSSSGIGARAAYASITSTVTQVLSTGSWVAVTGAPSVTLPNDGNTYKVEFTLSSVQVSTTGVFRVSIGTSGTPALGSASADATQANIPYYLSCDIQQITGSGQVLTIYGFAVTGTPTLSLVAGGLTGGTAELAAYRVV